MTTLHKVFTKVIYLNYLHPIFHQPYMVGTGIIPIFLAEVTGAKRSGTNVRGQQLLQKTRSQ